VKSLLAIKPLAYAFSPRRVWLTFLMVGAAVCGLYIFVTPFRASGTISTSLGLYGVFGVAQGIRIHRPRARMAWRCFAGGLFLFWLGDLYTFSYPRLFHAAVPFPSLADALYLLVYPALMTGLLVLVRLRNKRAEEPGLVDALIMSLGLALVSGCLLIAPYIHDSALRLLPKLVSIGHPMGDTILLAAGIRLAVDAGKRRPAFYLLIVSIVTLLTTDFVYGILSLSNAHSHEMWLDGGRIFFYLLWGAAALHPSMQELSEPELNHDSRLSPQRLAVLAGATFIAPALMITRVLPTHDLELLTIILASMVLFGLVVGRMYGLVRQYERSIARERSLTTATEMLVAATAPHDIAVATLQSVTDLAVGVDARLCRLGEQVFVQALGTENELEQWEGPSAVSAILAARDALGTVWLTPSLRKALRLTPPSGRILCLELIAKVPGKAGLVLLVDGPAASAQDTQYALRTLAHQVSLALASAELSEEVHRQNSEARFTTLVQNSSDLITVLGQDNTILYQSPSIERVLGFTPGEVVGGPFERLLHPDEQGRLLRRLTEGAAAAGRPEVIECLLRHRDGTLRHFEILHTNLLDDESVGGIVLNGRDVSERRAFEEQLTHQAFHDPVTHLANRALFNERVRHAVARAHREQTGIAVLFVDLDDFKTVNDSLGHAAGDTVLREVAKRVTGSIRAGDTAARFGGDEFAILLEEVDDVQVAADSAERILRDLARPLQVEQTELVIRASLGISVSQPDSLTGADELIRNADAAMYIAKSDGKGGYRLFESTMHEEVVARLELRASLQRALARSEFELYFQPLVRLSDGAVTGCEALLRWMHPERGTIPPDQFIPFAEESGLIVPIGRWVLHEGCRQARRFRDAIDGPLKPGVSINLSVKQLFHADIVKDVAEALSDSGLEPEALMLEITESVMMNDIELAVLRLGQLRELGVRLAMDDFGTGYSSLSYLSRFPLDVLKMDRSLLAAGASPVTSGLASAVLGLGETFELEVVAEGIEYIEQSTTLRELGCETGQGFYFARPMEASSLIGYLQDRLSSPHAVAVSDAA
jgi:diguanylate cyclase (GGDEF)-like protein/PAS domain S-box-containing protein